LILILQNSKFQEDGEEIGLMASISGGVMGGWNSVSSRAQGVYEDMTISQETWM